MRVTFLFLSCVNSLEGTPSSPVLSSQLLTDMVFILFRGQEILPGHRLMTIWSPYVFGHIDLFSFHLLWLDCFVSNLKWGYVTDITYPPYTPWGIRRLWGLGGLELFGNVDIYW